MNTGKYFIETSLEIKKRYQYKWSVNALAHYCWCLMTAEPNAYRRVFKRKSFYSAVAAYNYFSTAANKR